MYEVFARNWYKVKNKELVPDYGAKETYIGDAYTADEARAMCKEYNEEHGQTISTEGLDLSHKAEFRS